jgi:hypothetical protein
MRDANQFSIPSVHVVDDEKLKGSIEYPMPPGGALPSLDLAQSPGINVASGSSYQPMPDPPRPEITWPELSGTPEEIGMMGYDSSNPAPPAPNLAGVDGVPSPAQLNAEPSFTVPAILPDYGLPDFASLNVALQPYNLVAPGIHMDARAEFDDDPALPDTQDYNQPCGLAIHDDDSPEAWERPDPLLGDLTAYDLPGGVSVIRSPLEPDPMLPDLQMPQLTQDREMAPSDRPGNLDSDALNGMHQDPTYDQVKGVGYDVSFMTQPGSSHRSRKMDLLMHGLDGDL